MTETAGLTILPSAEERWKTERRSHIGASEAAAILGVDPRQGPLAVYASKLGYEQDDAMVLRRGRRLEPVIAAEYATETGREVWDPGAYTFREYADAPWLGATLDRWTQGSAKTPPPAWPSAGLGRHAAGAPGLGVPLELKAVLGPGARSGWEEGESPAWYQVQLQIQMLVTASGWGSLGALVGLAEPIAVRDHVRNDAFLAVALPVLEEFWLRVQRRDPPPADGLPGTTAAVRRLWGRENGQTVDLPPEALGLVEEWSRASAKKAAAEREVDRLSNDIRALLGEASFGALVDGSFVTLREVEKAEHVVRATSYRQLRRWWPKLPKRRS